MFKQISQVFILIAIVLVIAGFLTTNNADASLVDQLKDRISDRNTKIEELEKEIAQYQDDLEEVGEEKQTLTSEVKTLDISRQKIATDIKLTQNKIDSTGLQVQELSLGIDDKEEKISKNIEVIAETLRTMNEVESESLIEIILSNDDLSGFLNQVETLQQFQSQIRDDVKRLTGLKEDLEDEKDQTEKKEKELATFKGDLSDQKYVLDINRKDKNTLLEITENKESNYQNLLDEKIAARKAFERELLDLESQLKIEIDTSKIAEAGKGVLAWPLDSVKVTQYFGNTEFAQSGGYNGNGHNGMDFRASSGTKVKAALTGVVTAVGNTDAVPGCYSYGKFLLIKHNNGLTTLYAHLSFISAKKGDTVITGDTIGYSGNTGYSTGPHLHFTVYASQGVQIVRYGDYKAQTNCADANIPVAPLNAYLNPMDYL
ncbi:peptidoglycan DD-metalloendopeptidase family protein [bacterium]|jgi:murein DD-endopeptidase MepM/ murein hydrolase activator NlpD|nr:peptidoglycan DD-metalloendopeptidase family protein [Candidatus Woesearchaeota archaeon]MBT4732566.1 peptidoglycan DD-metalloendopeptidase family protein [Candidatus Woesearchaeota archaeon]MBT4894437.1 peptidoglycan DD-metalloendopeptidase family protein [bacterium]MBT7558406.1 peptidoglycan DD-metalloendopeptidase family protein [Candidatus Woesearchaeota archaeon]MBT7973008.1 peptidoglycan DD-metalloendopeptidase family protein [Candidatus Neomarinimicrobiota bacterium]